MKWMEGSQPPGPETIQHITYRQGGDGGVSLEIVRNFQHNYAGKWILLSRIITGPTTPTIAPTLREDLAYPNAPRSMR